MFRSSSLLLICLLSFACTAGAMQLAGVDLPERVQPEGADRPLVLNGAGIRKKFFVSVYVGALYLPQRQVGVGRLLSEPMENRVALYFVYRKVERGKLEAAWRDGFAGNLPEARLEAVATRLQRFIGLFPDMHAGDRVFLDYRPGEGTRVLVNDVLRGVIEGDDFNTALLAVWLGENPVTESLKKAMVGVDKQ